MDTVEYYCYQDADDRFLTDMEDDMEIDYLELVMEPDIQLPVCVIDGVPYYG